MTNEEIAQRVATIRAKREARGLNDPLNRLRAIQADKEPIAAKDAE